MPPQKPQVKRSSCLFLFCLIGCINVAVLIYISMQLIENQTQFNMLRRTDEIRRLQLLEDQGLNQYKTMEMIQSVHYRKTKDQREQDQYVKGYEEKYQVMQNLGEWILNNIQNEVMQNAQDPSVQYQDEKNLNVHNPMQHYLKYMDGQNTQEEVLAMQGEKEQELNVHDRQEQGINMNGEKEQTQTEHGMKEQHHKGQDINTQVGNEQDIKLQEPRMDDDKEEHDLKVQLGKEEKDNTAQGKENHDIKNKIYKSVINMQDQETEFTNMENNKKLQDKQEEGISVQGQKDDNRGIQNRDEDGKGKESKDSTNEKEDAIVQVQKEDSQGKKNLEEQDQKKQDQGKQNEKEADLKVNHQDKEGQDIIMQNPNQQRLQIRDEEGQNINMKGRKEDGQDLKEKNNLQGLNPIVQEKKEQEFQEQYQLLKQYLKSQVDHDLNDQVMHSSNGQDMKMHLQMMQEQTEIGQLVHDQTTAKLWTRHGGLQHQEVTDQQLLKVTDASEVLEV